MPAPATPSRPAQRAAIVTGAAKRVGAVIAAALGAAGWFVHVHYRKSAAEAEAVAAGIVKAGGQAATVGYDLEKLASFLQRVKQQFPDKVDATLLLEPDISYQAIVEVMDTVRVVERRNEASNALVQYELFPEISIGDAVVN